MSVTILGETERQMLIGLRLFGPCSIAALATCSNMGRQQVYAGVYRLRTKNLACRTRRTRYSLTKRGQRVFAELSVEHPEHDLPLWEQEVQNDAD